MGAQWRFADRVGIEHAVQSQPDTVVAATESFHGMFTANTKVTYRQMIV